MLMDRRQWGESVLLRYMNPDAREVIEDARRNPLSRISSSPESADEPSEGDDEMDGTDVEATPASGAASSGATNGPAGSEGREALEITAQVALRAASSMTDASTPVTTTTSTTAVTSEAAPKTPRITTASTSDVRSPPGPTPAHNGEPADHARPPRDPGMSTDAADALVSLKDRSPQAGSTPARATGDHDANHDPDARRDMSTPEKPPAQAPAQTQRQVPSPLKTTMVTSSSAPTSARLPPENERPHLPPLSQLTQLAAAAESLDAQKKNGIRPQQAPPAPMGGGAGASAGSPPQAFPSNGVEMATRGRRPGRPSVTQPASNGLYANHHPSSPPPPPGTFAETGAAHHEHLPRPRELSMSPPSVAPHLGSHPYIYNLRTAHASENGPPYGPAGPSEGAPPAPPMIDGHFYDPQLSGQAPHHHPMDGPHHPGHHSLPLPAPRQMNGHAAAGAVYQCTHPGCTAPPFNTQYLLKYEQPLRDTLPSSEIPSQGVAHTHTHMLT